MTKVNAEADALVMAGKILLQGLDVHSLFDSGVRIRLCLS